jgi:hypothetical protein
MLDIQTSTMKPKYMTGENNIATISLTIGNDNSTVSKQSDGRHYCDYPKFTQYMQTE